MCSIEHSERNVKMKDEKKSSGSAWVRLPLKLLQDERLTAYDCIVLAILIDRDAGAGTVKVKESELSQATKASIRHVRRCLAKLAEAGYIVDVKRTPGEENVYSLREGILPPKKRGQAQYKKSSKKEDQNQHFCDMDHFEEDYEIFINNF